MSETVKDDLGIERKLDRMYIQRHRQHQALYSAANVITPEPSLSNEQLRVLARGWRYWNRPPVLDQGTDGACTGFMAASFINAGPVKPTTLLGYADAMRLYRLAQANDSFPDTAPGSSVNGAMLGLRSEGRVISFHWAREMDTLLRALLLDGPIALGIDWTEDMMHPDPDGIIRATGPVVGGHAITLIGGNRNREFMHRGKMMRGIGTLAQSWGEAHGKGGFVDIPLEDLAVLLDGIEYPGDACLAVERRV